MDVKLMLRPVWPEAIMRAAAKTCVRSEAPHSLYYVAVQVEECQEYITKILKRGHWSIAEHCSYTFSIEGISRACLAQLSRHRHLSMSVQSQRHVEPTQFVVPPRVKDSSLYPLMNTRLDVICERYLDLRDSGVPKEDARYFLPMGTATNLVLTCNLRTLHELWQKRVQTSGSQWEIKELVERMVDKAVPGWLKDELFGKEERE